MDDFQEVKEKFRGKAFAFKGKGRKKGNSLNPLEERQEDRKSKENTRSPKSPNGCPYIW